jgi:hypothetical protein
MAAICLCLLFIESAAQEFSPPRQKVELDFTPGEIHKDIARRKAGALELHRNADADKTADATTNWQEYDITYYDIHWLTEFETAYIGGEVGVYGRATIPNLDSVCLNLTDLLGVDSVYHPSGNLSFAHAQDHLTIYLDRSYGLAEEFGFTIVYGGPAGIESSYFTTEGLYFSTWNDIPLISNLSEPFGSREWWPCNDIPLDKADSIDIRITVDTGLTATSNGVLVSDIDNADGTHTMHWRGRHPIVTYTVCLAIGKYLSWTDWFVYSPTDSMAIVNYVLPEYMHPDSNDFAITPEALAVYSDMFGLYPYIDEKYGNTMVNIFGMEHQNNTFLDRQLSQIEELVVHELAHHWWGNWVTCADWYNIWLNEGFATYSEALFYEVKFGHEYYLAYMDYSSAIFVNDGSVYVADTTDPDNIFSILQYNKGAFVLHMLRRLVGDSTFFASLQLYGQTYADKNVVTEDFQNICETVSGLDLEYFFQQWIYGPGWPEYRYSYIIRRAPNLLGWNTYVFLEQIQTGGTDVFITPVEFDFWVGSGFTVNSVMNTQRRQSLIIHTAYRPDSIGFDPYDYLLDEHQEVAYTLHIHADSLQNCQQAAPYGDTVFVIAANDAFTVDIVSGHLPAGLNLDSGTGLIMGTTWETGEFTFTVKATDALEPSYVDTREFTLTVIDMGYGPGDANLDGSCDVGDAVFLINHIFKGGPAPDEANFADVNADCAINVADAVYLINYVFKGGAAPLMGCVE